MARIAAIHALGDIWAMGARAAGGAGTVILPPMTRAAAGEGWLAEIMDAATGSLHRRGRGDRRRAHHDGRGTDASASPSPGLLDRPRDHACRRAAGRRADPDEAPRLGHDPRGRDAGQGRGRRRRGAAGRRWCSRRAAAAAILRRRPCHDRRHGLRARRSPAGRCCDASGVGADARPRRDPASRGAPRRWRRGASAPRS